mgnify:CR=1 FL=1
MAAGADGLSPTGEDQPQQRCKVKDKKRMEKAYDMPKMLNGAKIKAVRLTLRFPLIWHSRRRSGAPRPQRAPPFMPPCSQTVPCRRAMRPVPACQTPRLAAQYAPNGHPIRCVRSRQTAHAAARPAAHPRTEVRKCLTDSRLPLRTRESLICGQRTDGPEKRENPDF